MYTLHSLSSYTGHSTVPHTHPLSSSPHRHTEHPQYMYHAQSSQEDHTDMDAHTVQCSHDGHSGTCSLLLFLCLYCKNKHIFINRIHYYVVVDSVLVAISGYFRQSYRGSLFVTAQCIEAQLMPAESS